jgi:BolA protein
MESPAGRAKGYSQSGVHVRGDSHIAWFRAFLARLFGDCKPAYGHGIGRYGCLVSKVSDVSRQSRIETVLRQAFAPTILEVVDDSHRHAGHAGARPEGETHYSVRLVSPAFAGVSRVDRHRKVNAVLAAEFGQGLHALALTLKAPGE